MDINLYRESYGSHVREALGRNKNADLSLCCVREPTPQGDTYLIPSWKMKDRDESKPETKATKGKTREVFSRDDWEKLESSQKTMENFIRMLTPHQKIDEYYTVSNSQTIKGGHQFKSEKELVMGNDPTSRICTAVAQMVFDERQRVFIEALTADTVQRKVGTELVSVAMPDSQKLTAKNSGIFSVKSDLPRVKAQFRKANVPDVANIFCLISTDDTAMFEEENFEKIYNTDYVRGEHLRSGTIPEMFGVKWIPSNLIPAGTMWFWLYDALSWVPYGELTHKMGESPLTDFDVILKIAEHGDCKKTDDRGVLKFSLTA